jgi:hypothetical protein
MCDINKDLVISESNIIFGEIPNKDEDDIIFYDLNKTASNLHRLYKDIGRSTIYYTLIQNVFTDLETKKSNIKIYIL